MIKEFVQKKGLDIRKFTLFPDKIIIETKTFTKSTKYEVKLDQIGFDIHYQAENALPGKLIFGAIVAIIIGLIIRYANNPEGGILLFTCIWVIFAVIAFLKKNQDDVFLTGGNSNLGFFRNKPDERSVLNFIDLITKTAKVYIKNKYIAFDSTIDEQTYYLTLKNLKSAEIITDEEYQEYKSHFDISRLL